MSTTTFGPCFDNLTSNKIDLGMMSLGFTAVYKQTVEHNKQFIKKVKKAPKKGKK